MSFPSTLTSFSYPTASDRLNNPSHSNLHNTTSSAIGQLQTFIGTLSSAAGTLMYDIRSPLSNGGGHVQTAAKGGTGQTTFTKGDILVAQNASTLTKLAVGSEGQTLAVSSAAAVGVAWTTTGGTRINTSGSVITIISPSTSETSIMTATVPGSTLGTANAIEGRVFVNFLGTGGPSMTIRATYGSTSIATFTINTAGAAASSLLGVLDVAVVGAGSASSQMGTMKLQLSRNQANIQSTSVLGLINIQQSRLIYEDAGAQKTFGATFTYDSDSAGNRTETGGYIVQKVT